MNLSEPQQARPPAPVPVKCLIVDDMEENLLSLAALLEHEEVEVLLARSGVEALELLLVHDVALALLDVQMPEMDGFELAELIRGSERTRHIPLIFVTAGMRDQHRQFKGYETGGVDFLYKPVDPHVLINKAHVFFDLYRQKRALARELHERTETLRLNEMFMAVLGHDLRNPLSAIMNMAFLLDRECGNPTLVKQMAQRLLSSSQRMSGMIEDILDVARARLGGGIVLSREPADLHGIVLKTVQEHQAARPNRAIRMEALGDLRGNWDGNRLAQVVSNLVSNALQHGAPETPVELALDGGAPDEVVLRITNEGTIPPLLLSHIFDPFRGGDRPPDRHEGLGLGLYIVRQIVMAHGGTVEVESASRTTFIVRLPRA